jgi:hypothetical protein
MLGSCASVRLASAGRWARNGSVCSHCGLVIDQEKLQGRFAYAVITTSAYNS